MTSDLNSLREYVMRPWYGYGWHSPGVLIARLRNRWSPVFRLKMAWQRARRGHSDEQLWTLNSAVAELVIAGCNGMLEWGHGHPGELTPEEWDQTLTKIRDGFQAFLDDNLHRDAVEMEKFKEGMELFSHWFAGLWD